MRRLLIATHNPGKLREYQQLLNDLPLEVTSLRTAGVEQDVEEAGATFAENARLKAETYAAWTGLWTWADDSGLEVDALDKRPGVYSARYGGPGLTDEDRYRCVLQELKALPGAARTARFRCAIALAFPGAATRIVEATIEGQIIDEPRGSQGFGYDPIFFVPELNVTLAQTPPEVKNRVSHRGKAAILAKQVLAEMMHKCAS
jgi:XTP/dITP diphosphohydrolase